MNRPSAATLSLPLWLASALLDTTKILPVRLPFSALQFLSVLAAAVFATRARRLVGRRPFAGTQRLPA